MGSQLRESNKNSNTVETEEEEVKNWLSGVILCLQGPLLLLEPQQETELRRKELPSPPTPQEKKRRRDVPKDV